MPGGYAHVTMVAYVRERIETLPHLTASPMNSISRITARPDQTYTSCLNWMVEHTANPASSGHHAQSAFDPIRPVKLGFRSLVLTAE